MHIYYPPLSPFLLKSYTYLGDIEGDSYWSFTDEPRARDHGGKLLLPVSVSLPTKMPLIKARTTAVSQENKQ